MEWNFLPYFNLFVREGLFVHSSQQREERTVRAAVFINPSVTSCHLPYILRCKTQGRWVILTLRSLQCDTPAYGARQGRSLEVALYSFAMNKSFLIQPPRPAGTPPIFPNGNTGGEDWKWCFSFGIRIALCTSPLFVWLRHTPQCYGVRQGRCLK